MLLKTKYIIILLFLLPMSFQHCANKSPQVSTPTTIEEAEEMRAKQMKKEQKEARKQNKKAEKEYWEKQSKAVKKRIKKTNKQRKKEARKRKKRK